VCAGLRLRLQLHGGASCSRRRAAPCDTPALHGPRSGRARTCPAPPPGAAPAPARCTPRSAAQPGGRGGCVSPVLSIMTDPCRRPLEGPPPTHLALLARVEGRHGGAGGGGVHAHEQEYAGAVGAPEAAVAAQRGGAIVARQARAAELLDPARQAGLRLREIVPLAHCWGAGSETGGGRSAWWVRVFRFLRYDDAG
jgi:hypothetical protein